MPAAGILDRKKLRESYLLCTSPNELKTYKEIVLEYIKILEQITTGGGHPSEHKTPGHAWAPRRTLVGCAPLGAPPGAALAQWISSGP